MCGTRGVLVIKAQPIFNLRGQEHELPPEVINTVDECVAPKGYQRSGSHESLFMYSLGVYLKPIDVDDPVHKHYCFASPECRNKKHVIFLVKRRPQKREQSPQEEAQPPRDERICLFLFLSPKDRSMCCFWTLVSFFDFFSIPK